LRCIAMSGTSATAEAQLLSARVAALRESVLNDDDDLNIPRAGIVTRSYRATEGLPAIRRKARALADVIRNYPVRIDEHELIVGYQHHNSFAGFGFPEMDAGLTSKEGLEAYRQRVKGLDLAGDVKRELLDAGEYWHACRRRSTPDVSVPDYVSRDIAAGVFFGGGTCQGHTVPDYPKVIRIGFDGLAREVERKLASLDPTNPDDLERRAFLEALLEIARAAAELGLRHAEKARELARETTDPARRRELEEIAAMCERVPAHPARTFREALQSLWFCHMIMGWEDPINAHSLGRIDQYLYPYYARDLENGLLTREDALELMECLWLKFYKEYDVQQAVLGGQTPRGDDATNELTYICLDAADFLDLIRCMSVRVHKRTPTRLLRRALKMVSKGGGIPFFFNDEAIIPALLDKGIPLEDARDYAIIGCVEVTIPGRTNPHAVSHMMNLAKCLEFALNDGCDLRTGERVGPSTGNFEDFHSAEQLLAAYKKQFEHFARHAVEHSIIGELNQRRANPLPYHSLLTSDCIEKGRDLTDGGARFNYHSTCAIGIPNVADSIAAVKRLVFEEKAISPADLLSALMRNFDGCEELRQMLLKRAPKYGNDDDYVDLIAADVAEHYCRHMGGYRTPHDGTFFAHLFSFRWNVNPCGKNTNALPDGRKACEPLAYSISAMQGCDTSGLTALFKTLMKMPHHLAAGSSSIIIEIDPSLFRGGGLEKIVGLVKTAIDNGVGQMQFNVVTAETLERARRNPEKYRHVTVRVSGFSARFCTLDADMQDHIIARTKHAEA